MKRALAVLPLLVACGSDVAGRSPASTAHQAAGSSPRESGALQVNAEPTKLDPEQTARDLALEKRVAPILDAFEDFGGRLSPDGKKVLFQSDRGGALELFVVDRTKPGEAPVKVVSGPERVLGARWSSDGKWIVFRRDEGADENFRIYRVRPDGSELAVVTPGETQHRDTPLSPRSKPASIVFSTHDATSPATSVVVAPLTGGSSTKAFTDPAPGGLLAVTPDATHALYLRIVSLTDQLLFDVDLGTGRAKQVYPAEGKAAGITTAKYSADAKRILVATNEGTEQSVLLALDATTFKEVARFVQDKPKTAALDGIGVSPKGDRLCLSVDAGNHSEIRLLDAKSLRLERDVELPLGSASGCDFSDDGKQFALTTSTPDAPDSIVLVDAATGKVDPLRTGERPGLAGLAPLETTVTTIKAHDGLAIPTHFYLPKDRDPKAKLPVLVHFHGGPASSSSVGWSWIARSFTAQGFAFVEPNIRGSTGFGRAYEAADNREKRADALRDLATVNAWVRQQPWADTSRVVIFGGSYGGYLVLMGLSRQPEIWRAGVDLVGVANLVTFLKSTDPQIRAGFVDEFGDVEKDHALLESFSPVRDREKIVAPLFVYQGQNDPRVPRSESDQIVTSLRSRNVPVEYMVAANEGHSVDHRENRLAFVARVTRFLNDRLK